MASGVQSGVSNGDDVRRGRQKLAVRRFGGRSMIDWMLAARIDPLAAVIALSVALGLVVGIEMGRRF